MRLGAFLHKNVRKGMKNGLMDELLDRISIGKHGQQQRRAKSRNNHTSYDCLTEKFEVEEAIKREFPEVTNAQGQKLVHIEVVDQT